MSADGEEEESEPTTPEPGRLPGPKRQWIKWLVVGLSLLLVLLVLLLIVVPKIYRRRLRTRREAEFARLQARAAALREAGEEWGDIDEQMTALQHAARAVF